MPLDDRQKEILAACMDACERGDQASVERTCREWPELADDIQAAARVMSSIQAARGEPAVVAMPAMPTVIGRFRILGELGRGGMGVVYRALDPSLDREVAVKVQPGPATERSVERFRREARVLAQLRHPNIVSVHDVGETATSSPYFAMDLVKGWSLRQLLAAAAGRAPDALQASDLLPAGARVPGRGEDNYLDAALRLVIKIAGALQHAHEEGITHRDIKPSNLLVDEAGEPHLVDFGIARGHESPVAGNADTFAGAGTPEYMAPEQIDGDGATGPWTDIYALGVILYELITLQRPFGGVTSQLVQRRILEAEPRRPKWLNPRIPRNLETVCLTAMEKDPSRRYASARAFAEDLTSVLAGRPIRARPPSRLVRVQQFVRRNPWPTALAAAAVCAAIAGGIGRGVLVEWNRERARCLIEQAHRELMDPRSTERSRFAMAIDLLRRADALMPIEQPGRELIDAIERDALAKQAGSLLHGELGPGGGDASAIAARTRRALDCIDELAHRVPDAELLGRMRATVLAERALVMRPDAGAASPTEREFDRRAGRDGNGTLSLACTVENATAFLFRYERSGDVAERLVPAPVQLPGRADVQGVPREPAEAARATAYPLACSPGNRIEALPASLPLRPGSYLLLVQCLAHEDLRLPFALQQAGERIALRAELLPVGTSPPGFVRVPAGDCWLGGDGGEQPKQQRWLDDYWIGRDEVTCHEYLEFLRDERTRADIERARQSVRWILVPRQRCAIPGVHKPLWNPLPDGGYALDREPALPVSSISCEDGDAYCRWRTEQAAERGEPWLFRMPTEDEWEKAARGVDGRLFPWGNGFDARLCWNVSPFQADRSFGRLASPPPLGDESPFGVRHMVGGVLEWCSGQYLGTPQRPWRGGSWENISSALCRCGARNGGMPWRMDIKDGLRVAAVRRR